MGASGQEARALVSRRDHPPPRTAGRLLSLLWSRFLRSRLCWWSRAPPHAPAASLTGGRGRWRPRVRDAHQGRRAGWPLPPCCNNREWPGPFALTGQPGRPGPTAFDGHGRTRASVRCVDQQHSRAPLNRPVCCPGVAATRALFLLPNSDLLMTATVTSLSFRVPASKPMTFRFHSRA